MSENTWRDLLSPRCIYVYNNDTETIRSQELVRAVDGVVQAISVPDPADLRGGNRLLVLLNNEENKKHLENHGIIYQGRHLIVKSSNNTCDIPNAWKRFVDGVFQQPILYPSGQQSAQEDDVYANTPRVLNIPMPRSQHYMGQQMAATPGQQNPMNPGHIPFMHPFYMQGMPPNMYPQEGAVGQNVPPEAGNFPNPQQLWLQQMQPMKHMQQMFYQLPGTDWATAAQPPPYTPTEKKNSSLQESLESTEAAMIKVTNIPDGTSKDALLFFFENRRKCGGGSVEDFEYDPDTKSAVITFEEPESVKRVLGKLPILFNGVQIGVEEFCPDVRVEDYLEEAGEDSENILEVRGVSSKTREDVSDFAMSQHHIECQTRTCGSYSEFYCNACHQRMCGECRDEHQKHPDSSQHEVCRYEDRTLTVTSVPCKLHPRQQLTLCCKKCHQAICAFCTTKEHDGHGFLNLEEVYTENYKNRIEEIRKIRDDMLPKSRLRHKESKDATLEAKGNVEMLKNSMKEQANRIKVLVDDILTKHLQDLKRYEASTVEKLENQEKVMDSYVTRLQTLLEGYKHSISSSDPTEFLPEMSNTPIVDLDPIPEVSKESPRNFSAGKLNKDEISKQFGKLT